MIVAIAAIYYQYRQFKILREAVVVPAIISFDLELPETHIDWETGEELDKKFSKTTIPIYNYGGTSAINIAYSYRFANFIKMKEVINNNWNQDAMKMEISAKHGEELFDLHFSNYSKKKNIQTSRVS